LLEGLALAIADRLGRVRSWQQVARQQHTEVYEFGFLVRGVRDGIAL